MTGNEAVTECISRLKKGRCVKIWTVPGEEIAVHFGGSYLIFHNGAELCRGVNGGEEVIKEKFGDIKTGVYIL